MDDPTFTETKSQKKKRGKRLKRGAAESELPGIFGDIEKRLWQVTDELRNINVFGLRFIRSWPELQLCRRKAREGSAFS